MKKLLVFLLSVAMMVTMMPSVAWAEGAGQDIVIAENGTVTYGGESASTYSTGNYYAITKAGEFGDTVSSIKTEGAPANAGTSITYTGVRGIDNGESTLSVTSMPGGIDISNNGWIGAINQQSSSNTSGESNLNLQGIGDIKVKATGGTYSAKGIGIYGAKNTDITKNVINATANSLTVDSVGGDAYAVQGTLAGRTTTINITNDVKIDAAGSAYGTNLTAPMPKGKATLNFGSLTSSSSGKYAYGFHCAGGADADVILNGDMKALGNTYGTGFRLAGDSVWTLKGKEDKKINVTVSGETGGATGADIGGNNSTAGLNLTADKFTVTSSAKEVEGVYLRNTGTEFFGTLNELTAKTSSGEAYAIYNGGGKVVITPVSSAAGVAIKAEGTTKSCAVYAESEAVVNLTNADVTGDIENAGTINIDYKTAFKSKNVSNTGAIVVDMTGATADSYKLIDYTGSGTPVYGTAGTNYKFETGKDNGYIFKVGKDDKCLYAVLPPSVAQIGETKYTTLKEAVSKVNSGETIKLLADIDEESVNIPKDVTLDADGHKIETTKGWTLSADSITNINSLTNKHTVGKMPATGTVNGTVYAPSGTLDLRGVDLRLKGEPTLYGGTAADPKTLTELKATRVLFGDIYDGGNNLTIGKITLENCQDAYHAALGVYYDSLTVDDVVVDAETQEWYWTQQYNPYNYQMYTGFGGTLNIKKSLTTGEYMNAGYSVGGTGITNLAEGAVLNCVDFQNTGNSGSNSDEEAARNITDGTVHVNGSKATLNAAAINNHAITDIGTVNITAHPRLCTKDEGVVSVNYGAGAVLKIGTLNFLNKESDTTKSLMRAGDNAKTTIGGLTTSSVGADFYITGTSQTTVNKDGGNKVQYIGDVVFNKYSDSESNASFDMKLDSSDDSFTGSVKGTSSAKNRWGKWGWPVNDDAVASADDVKNMTMSMSNGSTWTLTDDSYVNNLTASGSSIKGDKTLTLKGGTSSINSMNVTGSIVNASDSTLNLKGSTAVSGSFTNSGTIVVDMTGATADSVKLIDAGTASTYGTAGTNYKFAEGKDNGYLLTVKDNDLMAVKPVAKIGDKGYATVQEAVNAAEKDQTVKMIADSTENVTVASDDELTLDLNGHVLKGTGKDSVIKNNGTLTISDSDAGKGTSEQTKHYYTVGADGLWDWNDSNTTGATAYEDLTARPAKDDVIAVKGGAITGGKAVWGGGIDNKGKLTMSSGTIVGCQVKVESTGGSGGEGEGAGAGTNESTFRGGAVYNANSFTLNGGKILGCVSSEDGGAVYNAGTLEITDGTIGYCTAKNAGAIYNKNGKVSVDKDAIITNCVANGEDDGVGYGGAIYNLSNIEGKELVLNGKISCCEAKKFGGGIFNKGSLTINENAIIEKCSADKGAGVHNDGNTGVNLTMNGGEIKNNIAEKNGGGVQNSENATFKFNGGSITGNNAKESFGGGVFTKGTMTIKNAGEMSENTTGSETKTVSNLAVVKDHPVTLDNFTGKAIGVSVIEKVSGVYVNTTGAFTSNGANADKQRFTSDSDEYFVKYVSESQSHLELIKTTVIISDDIEHGKIDVDDPGAATSTEVTVTATPDSGYELDKITVKDKDGGEISVTDNKFNMPSDAEKLPVTVSATFKKKSDPTPVITKYTVTFDVQGHGTAPENQTVEKGDKVKKPADPTASGYVFEGWFKEAACTNAWDFDKDTVTADTKLYAKWKEEEPQPVVVKDGFMATGTAKKATNTIKWNAVEDADGYDVYYAKCGKTLKKIKSTTALKYTKKGLKTKNIYKYQVRAYEKVDGEKEYMATTPVIHIAGSKAKFSNATKVTAKPDGVHMEAGDTQTIKTKIAKKSSKKTVLWKGHVSAKIRYISTDKSIATVNSKGKITGKNEGTAYVYAYAASGAFAKILVIVE